jgi:hypothetical protein
VSAVGLIVAFVLAAGPLLRGRADARRHGVPFHLSSGEALAGAAFFCLPFLSLLAEPRVAFWQVDGRALVIVAWISAISAVVLRRGEQGAVPLQPVRRLPTATRLFVLWSTLFWLMLVWDVGVGEAVALVTRPDRLLASFELWETEPAGSHLFLIWLSDEDFQMGTAYTNHLHPFGLAMYGLTRLVQAAGDVPAHAGRNVTPFAMAALGAVALAAMMPRPAPGTGGARYHAALFLALGFVLTQWSLWVYPFRWGFDTVFPVIAFLAAILWASARPRTSARNAAALMASALVLAAFGWLYTPLLILALWCVAARPRGGLAGTLQANRPLARASVAALALGVALYALPLVLIAWKGYGVSSSGFLFRSGLDGDTQYFQHAVQAVLQPFRPARTVGGLLFPAMVPFLIAAAWVLRQRPALRRRFGRETIVLLAPWVFSVALFPQAVSIHPNLYDTLLLLPLVLIAASWALGGDVQRRLRGGALLAALLLAVLLLMANLIRIAQGVGEVVRG